MDMSKTNKYAFLCCSSKDKSRLEPDISMLKDNGCRFVCSDNIFESGLYCEDAQEAIANCSIFLVFLTADSCKDDRVIEQIRTAYKLNKKIYPIVYPGCRMSNDLASILSNRKQTRVETVTKSDMFKEMASAFLETKCVDRDKRRELAKKLATKKEISGDQVKVILFFIIFILVLITSFSVCVSCISRNFSEPEVLYGQCQFTGVLREGGSYYYLELKKPISYRVDFDSEPITGSILYISYADARAFSDCLGMTLTLEGRLFDYRLGGTLMFVDEPKVISASGTAITNEKSGLYENWDTEDENTIYWRSIQFIEKIVYRCEAVWDVRALSGALPPEGFDESRFGNNCEYIMVSINDCWTEERGYILYFISYEDHIHIILENMSDKSYAYWDYDWAGRLIKSNSESLYEYLISAGIVD